MRASGTRQNSTAPATGGAAHKSTIHCQRAAPHTASRPVVASTTKICPQAKNECSMLMLRALRSSGMGSASKMGLSSSSCRPPAAANRNMPAQKPAKGLRGNSRGAAANRPSPAALTRGAATANGRKPYFSTGFENRTSDATCVMKFSETRMPKSVKLRPYRPRSGTYRMAKQLPTA